MNSEAPDLPSGPDLKSAETVSEDSFVQPEQPQEAPSTDAAPRDDAMEPAATASPGPSVPASVPGLPGAPGIPALPSEAPGDGLEDDDFFEIPYDEVEYGKIRKHQPAKSRPSGKRTSGVFDGRIVGKREDGFFVDIGQKSEAFLPVDSRTKMDKPLEVGDSIEVIIDRQSRSGYPVLRSVHAQTPRDWAQLDAAYRSRGTIVGKVTGTIKGGLSVDVVGTRAFMPASRSGERTEVGLKQLVGQEIRARIVQFDKDDRNVVLDRRAILEEERAEKRDEMLATLNRGDHVVGTVRTLRHFGAFVDLGGIDGLLHVSDISWQRVNDPSDVLQVGQEVEVEILKVDRKAKRIGVGLKQLQPEPWSMVGGQVKENDRIRGKVCRIKEYGAFVEVIPGVEGLVHISDMSYARRVRHPSEIVSVGDIVEVLVLDVKIKQRRISLGLKQALGDPWLRVAKDHPVGSVLTGTVRKILSFGAFVEVVEGVDALLHISDITTERRLNSPAEVLREGQQIRVKVLEMETDRRRLKVGMKQLEPSELDNFFEQVEIGETVMGRVVKTRGDDAIVEIGTGVRGVCSMRTNPSRRPGRANQLGHTSDLASLKTMLESAWRGDPGSAQGERQAALTPGSVHSFRITKLDAQKGEIQLARA